MTTRPRFRALVPVFGVLLAGLTPLVSQGFTTSAVASDNPCYRATAPVPSPIDDNARYEIRLAVACLVNNERAAWGLPQLTSYEALNAASTLHNQWMGSTHTFSHDETGPGSHPAPADRADASGYGWTYISENIAAGQTSPYDVVNAWLHSPGHCRNLMSPDAAHLGLDVSNETVTVGNVATKPIWTQVLGRTDQDAPSTDDAAYDACAQGPQFPARSAEFSPGEFTITETDFDGHAVSGPHETATVDPDETVAMERLFTLTNNTATTLHNPGFSATYTNRPVDLDSWAQPNVECLADDPGTSGYTLEVVGCQSAGDGRFYVEAAVPAGQSVQVKVSSYVGPSSEEHVGEKTGWAVTFTGRYIGFGELVESQAQPSFSQLWTWKRSHTSLGFGLRSVADGKPYEDDLAIAADGTATWTVPVYNKGADANPKKLTVFIDGARGAKVLSAQMPGASCAVGTSFESNHRVGWRCNFAPRALGAGVTRSLKIRAKAKTTAKGGPDRGAIGVQMGYYDVNESFGTDASAGGGYAIDTLPRDYPGVRSGRVERSEAIDSKMRATSFCRLDDDCDFNDNGTADVEERRSTIAVKATGGKKKATFKVTVKAGGKAAGGKVTVSYGGKVIKKVTLSRRGTATITVTKQTKGTRKYVLKYLGNQATKPSTKTVTVKVT